MTRPPRVTLLVLLPLYLALATAIGFVDYHARPYPDQGYTTYVPQVVAGTAEAPARYRVLAPWLFTGLRAVSPFAPVTTWLLFRWLCLLASLFAGHLLFRTWFDARAAAVGNLLIFALLPLTFTNSWPNPDQFTELALFTLAAACVARGWWRLFLPVLVLNAFNRETSAFLVLLFFVAGPLTRQHLVRTATAAGLWLVVMAGLRWDLGWVAYNPWQLWRNLGWLTPLPPNFPGYKRIYGWFFLVLLAPLFALALPSLARQPRVSRMAVAVVAPLYVVTAVLFSSTIESRIFTLVLPLLAPGALFTLLPRDTAGIAPTPTL